MIERERVREREMTPNNSTPEIESSTSKLTIHVHVGKPKLKLCNNKQIMQLVLLATGISTILNTTHFSLDLNEALY